VNDTIYNVASALSQFIYPTIASDDATVLTSTRFLQSLGKDIYKIEKPVFEVSYYKQTSTGVIEIKPKCVDSYCNNRGSCLLVDYFLVCSCKSLYTGKFCQIDKLSLNQLKATYSKL